MDWGKAILSGLKYFVVAFLAEVLSVLVGALTLALGFTPQGAIAVVAFTWIGKPLLVAIVGLLNNIRKHINDTPPK